MVFVPPTISSAKPASLLVVSWNTHVGAGDITKLARELIEMNRFEVASSSHIVLLLQEVVRRSDDVPKDVPSTVRVPARIQKQSENGFEIDRIARSLNLWMYYAPSMRNGARPDVREDRGSAILSTLPLDDFEAIELPFGAQRRVVVTATTPQLAGPNQRALRFVSVHLDARPSRRKQAAALTGLLRRFREAGDDLVIGADLNGPFGTHDQTVDALRKATQRVECGTRTFGVLTLDHFFTNLPMSWVASCERQRRLFGSDHHPLVMRLRRPG